MNLATQWMTMSLMLGSGILIGVILDFYRVITERFRLKRWIVSLIDLLYWMVSSLLVFGLLLWSNWGELRFYLFVAICLGFLLYFKWCSRLMISWIRFFFLLVEGLIHFVGQTVYTLIYLPLRWIVRSLITCMRVLASIAWTLTKWIGMPIVWLTRPLVRPLANWARPYLLHVSQPLLRLKDWWKKKREKGG